MTTRNLERGQVVVIEVILLLALLITVLALYQAFGVPDQNKQVEFDHNQEVQSDLIDLRSSLLDIRSSREAHISREHRSVRVRLGLQYASRIIGINPPDPQGTLRTHEYGEITIDGAVVNGDFEGDPEANMLDATHDTETLVYEPRYNEYPNPPTTVLEHSLAYNQLEASDRSLSNQRIVRGDSNSLNIILFDGDIDERGKETILDPETVDGPTDRVPIEAADQGEDIELVLPTRSPEVWVSDRVIGETFEEGEPDARAEQTGDIEVTITISGDETWNLQMTRVGYDGGTSDDTFSSIQAITDEAAPGQHDPVYGPSVTINEDDIGPREAGDEIDLAAEITGEISSIGSASQLRSGTPIQSVEYAVTDEEGDEYTAGTVVSLDPDATESEQGYDAKRMWLFNELPEGTISTTDWEPGEYTVTISAQDASGRITDEAEVDSFDVSIESDELFTDARVSDLVADEGDQTQTFEFDLGKDLENEEEVRIDLQDTGNDVTYRHPRPRGQGYVLISGSGEVDAEPNQANPNYIIYEAGSSDSAGDTIEIEARQITTSDVDSEYTITFSARDGDEETTATFTVS